MSNKQKSKGIYSKEALKKIDSFLKKEIKRINKMMNMSIDEIKEC